MGSGITETADGVTRENSSIPLCWMVRDLRQEVGELVEHVDDTMLTKQIGVVNYGELNTAIDFWRVKHDVEFG